jgi:hypothetical protein
MKDKKLNDFIWTRNFLIFVLVIVFIWGFAIGFRVGKAIE